MMARGALLGLFGVCLGLGAAGCGIPGPSAAPSSQPAEAPSAYSVQVDEMMPAPPMRQPRRGYSPRYRPRGSTIYLRGAPIIRETYPIPDWRRGSVDLRGMPIIPGTFDSPYPRPQEDIRQQRQMDFARVKLTEVENRIQQLEDMLSYTTVPSLRYRIWSDIQQQRQYRTTLINILTGR